MIGPLTQIIRRPTTYNINSSSGPVMIDPQIQTRRAPDLRMTRPAGESSAGGLNSYAPRTIDPTALTLRDGRLYTGDTEVSPEDRLTLTREEMGPTGFGDTAEQDPVTSTYEVPVWALDQRIIEQALPRFAPRGERVDTEFGSQELPADPGALASFNAASDSLRNWQNPYAYDENQRVLAFANAGNRPVLWGAYTWGTDALGNPIESADDEKWYDPGKYMGETSFSSEGGRGGRGGMTVQRANALMDIARRMYPDASQEELDLAAYRAQKKYATDPTRGRQDQWWYAMNMNDILRPIGAEMGGVPQVWEEYLRNTDAENTALGASTRKAAHKADDAQSGFLGDLGPLAAIAAMIPGPHQPFVMALNAANSLANGNVLGAALSAAGAYGGFSGVDPLVSADAASLASQGLSNSQIAATLDQTYNLGSAASNMAALGGQYESLAPVGGNYGSLPNQVARGALRGGAMSGFQGGNAVAGAATGGLTPFISSGLPTSLRPLAGTASRGIVDGLTEGSDQEATDQPTTSTTSQSRVSSNQMLPVAQRRNINPTVWTV